jgi:hypothetical protein
MLILFCQLVYYVLVGFSITNGKQFASVVIWHMLHFRTIKTCKKFFSVLFGGNVIE